jgi:hypothetical protein
MLLFFIGYHQADVEHFTVTLKPDRTQPGGYANMGFTFEADGDGVPFSPDQVHYDDGPGGSHAGKCLHAYGYVHDRNHPLALLNIVFIDFSIID